jgi:A/G-specific adenine glycosylase
LIRPSLCRWFRAHARDLPWRRKRNGYTALVAEMMLQQTQVSRVIESFDRFIERFPSVDSLANASEHDVLAMWRGLGYYGRALHLHAAAKKIVAEFGGKVPCDVEALIQLPGVGRYTAGAIASIVFERREPIVDGNVRRVLARLHAQRDCTTTWAWETSTQLVQGARQPGVFNEALMELGAIVCLPRSPNCEACPLRKMCQARRSGEVELYPRVEIRAKPKTAVHHAVVIRRKRGAEILLEQRGIRGMWANMWQTPTVENPSALQEMEIKAALSIPIHEINAIGEFSHQTTHRTIAFKVFSAATRSRTGAWKSIAEIERLPMSNAQRKVLAMVLPT